MRAGAIGLLILLGAQGASAQALTDAQATGRRLYTQSCLVCHAKPLLTAAPFGPSLSMASQGGDAAAMRAIIANGTPNMPGFKYQFTAAQIGDIVQYLKTVPAPAAAAPAKPRKASGAED
jgi:mono/diheme cytochrome c family protein